MWQAFLNIWRIGELRNKLLFSLGMLAIYRIGFFIPLPAVNQAQLADWAKSLQGGAAGNVLQFMSIFTGGSLSRSTLFALGIMPYISASIIMQLLSTFVQKLKELKEDPAGQQKIQEYTRYLTVGICLAQGTAWLANLSGSQLVYPAYQNSFTFWACGLLGLTAGAVFLMWLGEQIDKYGIGNGASLIITAGIVASMDDAVAMIADGFSFKSGTGGFTPEKVIILTLAFVLVVFGAVLITQGQRRIPIQQAKHTRGRKVYGGQRMFLPLRVNHGGVMPIIFASAVMMFPSLILGWLKNRYGGGMLIWLDSNLSMNGGYLYILIYIGLIYFFAYFWTSVQFQPPEMAKNLRNSGSFIPGLRPGPRTADYLETVMERITYVGAGFLAVIAVIPTVVSTYFDISPLISAFLGGTGLLICVSVILDMVQRIDANLLMRNYQGFLGGGSKASRSR